MKLKQKIILYMLAVGMIPLLTYFAFSIYKFRNATYEANFTKLNVLTATKKDQIEHDFEFMQKQIHVLSKDDQTIEAYKELSRTFLSLEQQFTNEKFDKLKKYYTENFLVEYHKKNEGKKFDVDQYLNQLSKAAIVAQYNYIADNPNPLGEKLKYSNAQDGSQWSVTHAKSHHIFKHVVEEFGYYDSFIVDGKSGNIIYTTFKEIDFATNLKTGPLKNTAIAKIFNQVMTTELEDEDAVFMTDLEEYSPSYEAPASFMGTPIRDDLGKPVAALIFQVPTQRLSKMLTNNGQWKQNGLGDTFESLLVNAQGVTLTDAREFIENPKEFKNEYSKILNPGIVNHMLAQGTSALRLKFNVASVNNKKTLEKFSGEFVDFHGESVYGVFTPVKLIGNDWFVVAKVDIAEANQAINTIQWLAIGFMLAIVIAVSLWARSFGTSMATPIVAVADALKNVQRGHLDSKIEVKGNDEVAEMSNSLNQTLVEMQKVFHAKQIDWKEISRQKQKEIEALESAQREKAAAEKALQVAEQEKQRAHEAMTKAVASSEQAEKEKQVANQERLKAEEAVAKANEAMKLAESEKAAADLERTRAREMAEKEQAYAKELQQKVDHILDCVSAAERGDLTKEVQVYGDDVIGKLGNGLKSLFRQLSQNMMTIGEMASILASQSEVLSQANNEMSSNAANTYDNSVNLEKKSKTVFGNMKSLSTSTGEMKIGVNEVAKQSSESSQYARNAVNLVNSVKDVSEKLSINAEDISKFIAVINSIARQTNLLALNATIEAARAGDAGKGFAIVANEVKELAKQSGNAAEEINQKVGVILGNSKDVMKSVHSVSELMDKLNQSSGIVAAANEEQFATTEQFVGYISKSTEEVEQINEGVAVIKQSAQSTSELIRSNAQLSVQLADAAEQLSQVVRRFKIKSDTEHQAKRKAA